MGWGLYESACQPGLGPGEQNLLLSPAPLPFTVQCCHPPSPQLFPFSPLRRQAPPSPQSLNQPLHPPQYWNHQAPQPQPDKRRWEVQERRGDGRAAVALSLDFLGEWGEGHFENSRKPGRSCVSPPSQHHDTGGRGSQYLCLQGGSHHFPLLQGARPHWV